MRLSRLLRAIAWWVFGPLLVSSVGWLIAVWYLQRTPGSDANSSWPPLWLKLHGGSAMVALLLLGAMIPIHLVPAWKARRNRFAGIVLTAVVAVLILTAWGLYYCGDEDWRTWMVDVHVWLGVASPFVLAWHIWLGRRGR